ncbi:hypothetical protein PSTG_15674 [Puccinia striiformis f. sp. tritici PST-78]|uniref:Uncharacterized protein n=1 Tax=Puccinia striiformis f. sp. tritici PST-78 TaxID=1165861 RepID=A0A0L0UV26_9BASI|nr:hypothetical protein PSTG_15674 [Puccinia striiformis f. sp. tritici PST-78]
MTLWIILILVKLVDLLTTHARKKELSLTNGALVSIFQNPCGIKKLVVGNGYALGSISETSREIASSPVVHESSTNQIDRDRIGCDGRRISPSASVSRVDPPSRLEEVPQTVQIVIEHPAERASTEL